MKAIKVVTEETKEAIRRYLALNEKFRNAYFFTPQSSAGGRRRYENENTFDYDGDGISLKFSVKCSCKNVYIDKCIKIDGKITNATSLKKFVK